MSYVLFTSFYYLLTIERINEEHFFTLNESTKIMIRGGRKQPLLYNLYPKEIIFVAECFHFHFVSTMNNI